MSMSISILPENNLLIQDVIHNHLEHSADTITSELQFTNGTKTFEFDEMDNIIDDIRMGMVGDAIMVAFLTMLQMSEEVTVMLTVDDIQIVVAVEVLTDALERYKEQAVKALGDLFDNAPNTNGATTIRELVGYADLVSKQTSNIEFISDLLDLIYVEK